VKSVSDLGEAEPSLRLSLDARPESIALLRRQLGGWLEETGATRGELFEIQLATTEAFANAVYTLKNRPPIWSRSQERSRTDRSRSLFATTAAGSTSRRQRTEAGSASRIMDELMDSVLIEPFAGGTVVTMQRQLASSWRRSRAGSGRGDVENRPAALL
jgi:anti-sigma regulatory factor (Ser/Thr protein kinase)